MSTESVMLFNHLTLCCPPLLPSVFSSIRVFSSELALHIRCPKYWSFSFSISPSSVYSGFISLRIDWFDLFALQGLSRVFSSISSLALSLLYSPTFTFIQDYWKNHSFDYTGLFGKVMSLLFNTLSRFVKMKETWLNAWVRSWNQKRILRKNWQNLNIVWSLVSKNTATLVT